MQPDLFMWPWQRSPGISSFVSCLYGHTSINWWWYDLCKRLIALKKLLVEGNPSYIDHIYVFLSPTFSSFSFCCQGNDAEPASLFVLAFVHLGYLSSGDILFPIHLCLCETQVIQVKNKVHFHGIQCMTVWIKPGVKVKSVWGTA